LPVIALCIYLLLAASLPACAPKPVPTPTHEEVEVSPREEVSPVAGIPIPKPEEEVAPDEEIVTYSSSPPINVRVDYIGVKGISDHDDPWDSRNDVQLIAVITDGKRVEKVFIPSQQEYLMEPYQVQRIDRRVFHSSSVGDYLRISMVAYDIDSEEDTEEFLRWAKKWPETSIATLASMLEILLGMLPQENELLGEYEHTWYPDENWGIGQSFVISRGHFVVGFQIYSEQEPALLPLDLPDVPEFQVIRCTMPPNTLLGSYARCEKYLEEGQEVKGLLRLTGFYPAVDWDSTCCFSVYDPLENKIREWCEDFKEGGLFHQFSFKAFSRGKYTVEVHHCSFYHRELYLQISPYGWERR